MLNNIIGFNSIFTRIKYNNNKQFTCKSDDNTHISQSTQNTKERPVSLTWLTSSPQLHLSCMGILNLQFYSNLMQRKKYSPKMWSSYIDIMIDIIYVLCQIVDTSIYQPPTHSSMKVYILYTVYHLLKLLEFHTPVPICVRCSHHCIDLTVDQCLILLTTQMLLYVVRRQCLQSNLQLHACDSTALIHIKRPERCSQCLPVQHIDQLSADVREFVELYISIVI
mmetsp:Transcript_27149/g.45565  ORF Transcript_27149/g.45565 Transcript_27149/m.45565 type:complete len:223 (+) Transcript_27149:2-670(+)